MFAFGVFIAETFIFYYMYMHISKCGGNVNETLTNLVYIKDIFEGQIQTKKTG